MEIEFLIGSTHATLRRESFFGGMKLSTPDQSIWLQRPCQPSTHFSFRRERYWQRTLAGHQVRVEKVRTLLLAGIRPQGYKIFVDEQLVASTRGI